MASQRVSIAAAAVLVLGVVACRSLLFVGGTRQAQGLRGAPVAMHAKVWNMGERDFVEDGSPWENPQQEGMSHPLGLKFAPMKPEKPAKGYYYNRDNLKVEVDGPNDPTTAGLPGWSIEANAEGKLRFDQERTYGWRVGPGEDNVSVRPVR